ncbi:hypothetical protein [Paraburkholderia hayleyella]|uniref:hypothetical protein n=1 Tax=Paraburkholderia hayleyella TaxID=2152889 RepID=UPI001290DC16|nr:hypothetical protein [Paraburkholderia hayleyella]
MSGAAVTSATATMAAWRALLAAREQSRARLERELREAQRRHAEAQAALEAAGECSLAAHAQVSEHEAYMNRLLATGRALPAARYLHYAMQGEPLRHALQQALAREDEARRAVQAPLRELTSARLALVRADIRRDAGAAQLRRLTLRAARTAQRRAEDEALDLAWARRALQPR